jgi:aminopeptidase
MLHWRVQRSFEENLSLYAELIVKKGLAIAPGRELLIFSDIYDPRLARLVAKEAYRAGAKNAEVMWTDETVTLLRYQEGSEAAMDYVPQWLYDGITAAHRDGAARLGLYGTDPGLLSGIPPDRVARNSRAQSVGKKELSELITADHFPWCLVGAAAPGWAARVFPGLDAEEAVAKLWDAIFLTSRVLEPDPIGAWSSHCDALDDRVRWLNALHLDALHFSAPGTDLTVGLAEGHAWQGGWSRSKDGTKCSPNIPTEEVFTMPHRARVDGIVSSSKPLSVRGQIVDGIRMEFRDGVAVQATAEVGNETLRRLLESDEGGRRLGEVALVPHSSKVSQAGILFFNSLYDENAASHIAIGAAYSANLPGHDEMTDEERIGKGANDSIIHVDWMIGSGAMNVDGIGLDGSVQPILRNGEWA